MAQIEFNYNQNITKIQCKNDDKFSTILKKLVLKIDINLDSVFYLYSGKRLENKELTFDEIISQVDKPNNKMIIQIYDLESISKTNLIIKSNQIICPKCQEVTNIIIKDYKIRLYDCLNKHDVKNILLEEYEGTQKINLSKIICNNCKAKNKALSYQNLFYKCNTCDINLCPICRDKHNSKHFIINYDDKNYICKIHNYPFSFYCKSCKSNICILCENNHSSHNIISYGKIIPNKEKLAIRMKDFKQKIDLISSDISEIINKLLKVNENLEILYKIFSEIIDRDDYKNYEILNNIAEINFDNYIKDFNEIIEDKNIYNKFKNIFNIYDKMINANVPIQSNQTNESKSKKIETSIKSFFEKAETKLNKNTDTKNNKNSKNCNQDYNSSSSDDNEKKNKPKEKNIKESTNNSKEIHGNNHRPIHPSMGKLCEALIQEKGIRTQKVYDVMMIVDRADFAPKNPYENHSKPLPCNTVISQPLIHAYCLEVLKDYLHEGSIVLDVGFGSGYFTLAMSKMMNDKGKVVGIDHMEQLYELAKKNISKHHKNLIDNKTIELKIGDGRKGFKESGPYDCIHVGAATMEPPKELLVQLKIGGRLLIPLRANGDQYIYTIDKLTNGNFSYKRGLSVCFSPLTSKENQMKMKLH